MTLERPEGFETFLKSLKERISSAQTRAALAVSRELLELYWTIGRDLEQFAAQLVSQLPWGQNALLLHKVTNPKPSFILSRRLCDKS